MEHLLQQNICIDTTKGVKLIGFEDDTAAVITAKNENEIRNKTTTTFNKIKAFVTTLGLQIANEKLK